MRCIMFVFFFSSRRRHTRLQGDWSSDVCSSDLSPGPGHRFEAGGEPGGGEPHSRAAAVSFSSGDAVLGRGEPHVRAGAERQGYRGEGQAAARIARIYDGVQRQLYIFLAATLIAIVLTSLYLIRSNRQIFARLAELSEQRSDLAQKLISTQESTLRHISRELHDEFGQVLTAIGSMLGRAGKHAPEGSLLRQDLKEVQEIAQSTLNNIRTLSQALHPVLLEEAGLESTLDWYIPTVGRQTGLALHYEKTGQPFPVETSAGVHIYRVLQEALNNVSRHSGAGDAWVRLRFSPDSLELEVEDHGKGFLAEKSQRGIGLVAMRERAELIGGTLAISPRPQGGTKVRLQIPRIKVDANGA